MPKPVKSGETEVVPSPRNDRRQRRRFTPEQKRKLAEEANAATERGQIGAILRREGIYSSQLTEWRRQLERDGVNGLANKKPGRKGQDPRDRLIAEQEKRIARLEKELRISKGLMDISVKAHEILGIALPKIVEAELDDSSSSSDSARKESR